MFIGIGAQKAGTTWLANYLSSHPEVFMSPLKELHYFNSKHIHPIFNTFFVRDIRKILKDNNGQLDNRQLRKVLLNLERLDILDNEDYMNFYKRRVRDQKVFGEITPAYSMLSRDVYEEISRLHDDVKFIFGMRNPADRFWSHLRHARKYNENFDPKENFYKKLNDREFIKRTNYKRTILELEKAVNRDNIFYYFYEDLFSEKGKDVVKELTKFLGIDYIEPDFDKNINVSEKIDIDDNLKNVAIKKFEYVVKFVDKHFNGNIPENWKSSK